MCVLYTDRTGQTNLYSLQAHWFGAGATCASSFGNIRGVGEFCDLGYGISKSDVFFEIRDVNLLLKIVDFNAYVRMVFVSGKPLIVIIRNGDGIRG